MNWNQLKKDLNSLFLEFLIDNSYNLSMKPEIDVTGNRFDNSLILKAIQFRPLLFFTSFILITTTLLAESVFRDDFSSPYFTTISWLLSDQQNAVMTVSNQSLNLKNAHQYNSIIAFHSLSKKYREFTLSTTILSESAGSGLFFNVTTDQSGKINGYGALLTFDKIELVKFSSGSHTTLASQASTFIKQYDNVLTVSKKDSLMQIFCNGYFLYSCIDGELPEGDIALMVQPRSSTLFGDFEFLSTPLDSTSFKPFIDNFDTLVIFGWRKSGNGITTNVDSTLEIQTNSFQQFLYTIDQPMNSFQLETDIFQQNIVNNDSAACGVAITAFTGNNFDTSRCIRIGFDHKQNLTITGLTSDAIIKSVSQIYRHDSTWKRLKLTYNNPVLRLYCDGQDCIELSTHLHVNGAGLFSSRGPVVRFDNFLLRGTADVVSVTNHPPFTNQISWIQPSNISAPVIWSDLLGRKEQYQTGTPKCATSLLLNNRNQKIMLLHINPY
jgi:hypothetical protein